MKNPTNEDYFENTGRHVWIHGTHVQRAVYAVDPQAAAWDGVPQARLALRSQHGGYSFCEIKATGRRWRHESVHGTFRFTVRVRFLSADAQGTIEATDWTTGEVISPVWTDEKPTF